MDTNKYTPLELFHMPQHFVVPLFQRPYVWKEEEQWEPLWKDVRRVADLRIADPHLAAQHFLGAVVLQSHQVSSRRLTAWNIIDGQQRLTTLQLLADAACAVFTAAGFDDLTERLVSLTHNHPAFLTFGEDSPLKLRHMNKDKAAFDEVMLAEPPIDYASLKAADSRIVHAHSYFNRSVAQWLGEPDEELYRRRAEELTSVLMGDLQLVTIELTANENSQEIFETLNARGTPLTAADLVRNFVFQRLEAEGGDTKRAYVEDWPFESKFWAREVSVGRYFVSRSSLFLNQWLTSRLGEEISPQSTFTRFKSYVEHSPELSMAALLPVLKEQAQLYEKWTEAAGSRSGELNSVEMAVYRMQASGSELLKPLLIWMHEPGRNIPAAVMDEAIRALESWTVRRQLLRLTTSELGRIVADLIARLRDVPPAEVANSIVSHLSDLNVTSTYWPGDEEVRNALLSEPAYRRYPRTRLRSYLEAIENSYRAETGQPQVERVGFPIEHVLPQSWRDYWPVDDLDEEEERSARVHRLGNLTLLTTNLNSKVSNGPWEAKRAALLHHNTIKLTGRLLAETDGDWDEEKIDRRTEAMTEELLDIWPVPEGHEGRVRDPQTKAQGWVEVKHLIEGGFLAAGDILVPQPKQYEGSTAVVQADGYLKVDEKLTQSPSRAAQLVNGKPTNGWHFWALPDGRRLRELRTEFMNGGHAWNGKDWYVSFGEEEGGRQWADGRRFGFVSAGGSAWYSDSLRKLPVGARIWAYIPQRGYVGVGTVAGEPRRFDQVEVTPDGGPARLRDLPLQGSYRHDGDDEDANAEWAVPVEWVKTLERAEAFREPGLFANQNSATRMRDPHTLQRLATVFDVEL